MLIYSLSLLTLCNIDSFRLYSYDFPQNAHIIKGLFDMMDKGLMTR